jgi:16S rRNA (cytosine967-C5)-methyltransferase
MNSSAEIRAQAARHVAQVVDGRSLDALPDYDGTPQERGLLRTLVYDSVRWYIRLDALLEKLLARPQQRLDPEVRALAIVGLCQLLHSDIPPHAAVAETVNATRVLGRPRVAGLLNALLRRCQREGAALVSSLDADMAVRTAHPRWFVDAMRADFPGDVATILDANNARPPFWIRVNRRRISGPAYRDRLNASGIGVARSLFEDEALLLERAVDVAALPGFGAGEVSVQDAAAQLAARLVAPQPGERILDACAAPGGKTGHLLELQPDLAELVAVDASAARLERVRENLQRLQLAATLIVGDAERPEDWADDRIFDRILLDVPCSATGVIRRHPDIKLLRRAEDIPALAARQARLLRALWQRLAPGGRLVYASCSALRAENAAVVADFLQTRTDARDSTATILRDLPLDPAIDPAIDSTRGPPADIGYRIAVGTADLDGFYYACLEKTKG